MERNFYVYMLASQRNGTLYTGVTSNLSRRVYEHREGIIRGFTADYGVKLLVWYEGFPTALEAIAAEKRINRWRRAGKLELIERKTRSGGISTLSSDGAPRGIPGSRLCASLRPG